MTDLSYQALRRIGFPTGYVGKGWPESSDAKRMSNLVAIPGARLNSIFLSGVVGAGKSCLLGCIAKTDFDRFCESRLRTKPELLPILYAETACYVTHSELSDLWSHEFDDNGWVDDGYFHSIPTLFLDDLGTAPVNASGRNISKIERLIDYRCSNHLRTFIASNVSLADMAKPAYRNDWGRIGRRLGEKEWMFYLQLPRKYLDQK